MQTAEAAPHRLSRIQVLVLHIHSIGMVQFQHVQALISF